MLERLFMMGVVGVGRARDPEIANAADNTLGEGIEVGSAGVVLVDVITAGDNRELCIGKWTVGSVSFKEK
jgi:hypothetical protein